MSHRRFFLLFAFLIFFVSIARAGDSSFELVACHFPPGPTIPQSVWGGLSVYRFAGEGAKPEVLPEVPASELRDPGGLFYDADTHRLYVSNRAGNAQASSVRIFDHKFGGPFEPGAQLPENDLRGSHGMAYDPERHELFVVNHVGNVARYLLDGAAQRPHGIIDGAGSPIGIALSPDGKRLFLTTGADTIRQWDFASATWLRDFRLPRGDKGAFMRFRGTNELYVACGGATERDCHILRLSIDANDDLAVRGTVNADSCISVAFSPDLNEMFVAAHVPANLPNRGLIHRFIYAAASDGWKPTTEILVGKSLGDLLVIPSSSVAASMTAVAAPAKVVPAVAAPAEVAPAVAEPEIVAQSSSEWNIWILAGFSMLSLTIIGLLLVIMVVQRSRRE